MLKVANNLKKCLKFRFSVKKCRKIDLEDSKLSALKCNSCAGFLLPCECRKMLFCLSKPFGNSHYIIWPLCHGTCGKENCPVSLFSIAGSDLRQLICRFFFKMADPKFIMFSDKFYHIYKVEPCKLVHFDLKATNSAASMYEPKHYSIFISFEPANFNIMNRVKRTYD